MSQRALSGLRRVVELVDMEAAGIEPASRDVSAKASTCVADCLSFAWTTPVDRVCTELAENEV